MSNDLNGQVENKRLCPKCGREETRTEKWINGRTFYGWECEPCKWNMKWYGEFPYRKEAV